MPYFRHLLDALEDPFEMFPMQSVARQLAGLVAKSEDRRFERSDPWGYSPPHNTVEDEHDIAVVQLLIGSAFVLGQAAITQAVSIATKLRDEAKKPSWLPKGKATLMLIAAPIEKETGLSKIVLIDAVANYFKHHYEWPDDWSESCPIEKTTADKTISIVRELGLIAKGQHNLTRALQQLGAAPDDTTPLSKLVQEWREQLAAYLRNQLEAHYIDDDPPPPVTY